MEDTGIGIPKEKLDIIFERFQQVENGSKIHEGTGLGLSISKGIIHLMGGVMNVESKEGKGSVFSFEIPFKKAPTQKELADESYDLDDSSEILKGKTILIAEDETLNVDYFKFLFEHMPVHTKYAENGKVAIEMMNEFPDIDVVLMDVRMPIMDGYQAAKEILKEHPKAKIIAQSAYAMKSDKEKALKSGFVDFLSKPFNRNELIDKLVKWLK